MNYYVSASNFASAKAALDYLSLVSQLITVSGATIQIAFDGSGLGQSQLDLLGLFGTLTS